MKYTEEEKNNIEIINNLKKYFQNNIDKGYSKFVYNDYGLDEKNIDILNALDYFLENNTKQQKEIENYKKNMAIISEICIDESKLHITSKKAIKEVRNYLICWTKKEKKAIENFKYWIQTNTERGVCTIPDYICINALNLLEKQQKEIEKKDKIITEVERYARGIKDEELLLILKKDEIEKLVNECEELLGDE